MSWAFPERRKEITIGVQPIHSRRIGSEAVKRLVDVCGSLSAIVVLAPVFLGVAILVRFCLGRPVLFRQLRAGRGGRPFVLLKFRTMADRRDPHGEFLPDAQRLTRVGQWLRRTSLDELPELWNVLKGDMSLVGPRPLLPEYLPFYTPEEMSRHEVRPGLTGLAQVMGRNALSWDEKLALDIRYVRTRGLALDLAILFRTMLSVARREGISAPDHATMPRLDEQRGRCA